MPAFCPRKWNWCAKPKHNYRIIQYRGVISNFKVACFVGQLLEYWRYIKNPFTLSSNGQKTRR
jgi:hypothetical protein